MSDDQKLTAKSCPCCGQTLVGDVPADVLSGVVMTPTQQKLLGVILERHPRPVPTFAQVDAVWGDRPDGGPDGNTVKHLAVLTHYINRRIAPYGWKISAKLKTSHPGRFLQPVAPMVKKGLIEAGENSRT